MKAYERLLRYVTVYTTSDPENDTQHPSAKRQFDLARILLQELKELGVQDARLSDECYVYGSLPATPGCEKAPAIGLVAHMDTAPDAPGENVAPLLHKNYDGKDLTLPSGHTIPVATFPALATLKGKTLITASGATLLGADDKAGIAEIMAAVEALQTGTAPHGKVCIAFTPDEEIGQGAAAFDVAGFGAEYAYTVDGGPVGEIEYETFNAARALVEITGVEVHPGAAKGIMVNALRLARQFDAALPDQRPENTEGYEGYFHLHTQSGNVGSAKMQYIIRDHDAARLEERKEALRHALRTVQEEYPTARLEITLTDEYRNMAEVVEQHPHLLETARQAIRALGLEPLTNPVRGGTDGSALSFMGLPCPNLGTGGYYFHGPNECITAEDMDKSVEVLLGILSLYAEKDAAALT